MVAGKIIAASGSTAAYWATNIGASLLAHPEVCPLYVLVNLGVNDMYYGATEESFKADYGSLLDQIHVYWPDAQIGYAHVWHRLGAAEDATLNTWIDAVIADGREAWTFPGPDEQVWLEGGDDGATMTYDGTHYSTAGKTECAAQWKTAMGL